jgi:hypothetical protein
MFSSAKYRRREEAPYNRFRSGGVHLRNGDLLRIKGPVYFREPKSWPVTAILCRFVQT